MEQIEETVLKNQLKILEADIRSIVKGNIESDESICNDMVEKSASEHPISHLWILS